MANNLVPPDALKAIKPYLTLASQLDAKNDKVIAYYCRLYSVQNGMQINKSAPECKKFLLTLMDSLENSKKEIQSDEGVQSAIVGQAYVERYALKIFECADEDDRASRFSKNLVKQFYSAGLLFDVLNYFGDLSEDLVIKKQYAKHKAMYLNKCFQIGETPVPGPLTGEDGDHDDFGSNSTSGVSGGAHGSGATGYNHSYDPTHQSPEKNAYNPYPPQPQVPYSPPFNNQYNQINSGFNDMNINRSNSANKNVSNFNTTNEETKTNYSTVNPEMMLEAQKLCKHATSALQYDDVQTAIQKLESCLRLLKGENKETKRF